MDGIQRTLFLQGYAGSGAHSCECVCVYVCFFVCTLLSDFIDALQSVIVFVKHHT